MEVTPKTRLVPLKSQSKLLNSLIPYSTYNVLLSILRSVVFIMPVLSHSFIFPHHLTVIHNNHFTNPLMYLSFITAKKAPCGLPLVSILPLFRLLVPPCSTLSRPIAYHCTVCQWVWLRVCVLPSAAGNLITALVHQREEEGAVVRKRNAALQFLFSPVMERGLPGLFKCLMWSRRKSRTGWLEGVLVFYPALCVCTSMLRWFSLKWMGLNSLQIVLMH